MLTELQKRKLTKLFTLYDVNHSGDINLSDFEQIIQKIAQFRSWVTDSFDYEELSHKYYYHWIHIKGEMDRDRNNKLSLDEWLKYYDNLLENRSKYEQEIKSLMGLIYDIFDRDGDGHINQKELEEFLTTYNVSPIHAENILSVLDHNEDGLIDKSEFFKMLDEFHYSDDPDAPGNQMFGPY